MSLNEQNLKDIGKKIYADTVNKAIDLTDEGDELMFLLTSLGLNMLQRTVLYVHKHKPEAAEKMIEELCQTIQSDAFKEVEK